MMIKYHDHAGAARPFATRIGWARGRFRGRPGELALPALIQRLAMVSDSFQPHGVESGGQPVGA
jgi:hypothetical protein